LRIINVKRIIFFCLLISIFIGRGGSISAQDSPKDKGLLWLLNNQDITGFWGNPIRIPFRDTCTVIDTLLYLKATDSTNYSNGIQWILTSDVINIDSLSRKILSLSTTGNTIQEDVTTLTSLQDTNGGWGLYYGQKSDPMDTALGLLALKAVDYSDQTVIQSAIDYLISTQNSDGGWGFYQGDDSNVYMTALVSSTLQQFPQTTSTATAINKAIAYLIAHQNADGGFGEGGGTPPLQSTVYETSLAYLALVGVTTDATVLGNAINYLTSSQLPDGSWEDDPYSTALALRALANIKPNMSISSNDITFSNPTPTAGETITITANVKNSGIAQADNVFVQFYDGDPGAGGNLIGGTTITSLPAYSSGQAAIQWTIPTASAQAIYVVIDPLNTIDELNESDNTSSKNLTSSTLPDLSITASDITFTPSSPMPLEAVTITAIIRNNGETAANNVTVDIYDGNPSSGGIPLGNTTFTSISAGGTGAFNLTTNFTSGNHDIYIVADKANTVFEGNEQNNIAAKTLQVQEGFIELSIMSSDITYIPANPVEGNIVTLTAIIHNEGLLEADNVLVRFYLGDPDSGGTQIGTDINIPAISSRNVAVLSIPWDSTGHAGNNDIYVKVDPLNTITEMSKLNNKAYKTTKVAAQTGPDLTVAQGDINFVPLTPNMGDMVTITAKIRNTGTLNASNVFVEFSLGDPNVGGTLIIGSQTIASIAKGSYATAQIQWNTTGFSGSYEVYANADPFNGVAEFNEINNTAHAPLEINAPQGPDITITSIDTTNLITDTQTLAVSGSIKVTIQNKGNQPTNVPFDITAFEDRTNPPLPPFAKVGISDTDNKVGKITYTNNLAAGATDTVDILISGKILFRDNLIYVMIDSGNSISELNETNNTRNTGEQCEYKPPVGTFNPVEKWHWQGVKGYPTFNKVMMTPVVARIADTNGDGVIDDKDVPAVIFSAFESNNCGINCPGILTAVRGDTGEEIWSVTNPFYRTSAGGSLAVGDIDNDGMLEIIAVIFGGDGYSNWNKAGIFNHDGTLRWVSSQSMYIPWGGASIADLDGDGKPEIIIGATVLNNDGTLRWQGTKGTGNQYPGLGPLSLVADVDMDGHPEVVAGNTIYRYDGTVYWQTPYPIWGNDGFDAVANFDNDPYPEIVFVSHGNVYLFKRDGTKIWGPVAIPGGGNGGPPTIADFDGDGSLEIGVAGSSRYVVFRSDGSILWQSVTQDLTSGVTGSSVFDFDGDGQAEVVYNDEIALRIYRGKDGMVLFSTPNSTATTLEYPVIADIDNDNHAEIVVAANDWYPYIPKTSHGIRVFEDANNTWVNTRKIWNQHTYHITNVNDDGTIPRHEQNNWEIYNNYRCNSLLPEEVLDTADITTSYITIGQNNYPTSVTISARIGNGGAISQVAGVDVAFYDGDPSQGGILIGTAKTTRVLDIGEYEDVSITWNNPSSGSHTIFVVADKDNEFNECREGNNKASTEVFIGITPPVYYPDLSISQQDVTIIPPNTIEGQPARITAIIHNTDNLGASDVVISFYDGDPQSGGTLIGSLTKSQIDAGATALAEITWNTFGQSGRNYIHVIVDPKNLISESNENNNSTLISIDVSPPAKPDLAITSSDMTFSSLNPREGDPLTLNAAIHNFGTDASDIEVSLYDGDPSSGGTLISQQTIRQIIPFGGTYPLSFNIDTISLTGNYNFYITLDPNNRIDETNETNNTAWNSLTIGSSGLNLSISTDKTSYTANEDTLISVNIQDILGSDRSGILTVKVVDLNNNVVSTVTTNQAVTLSPNENKALTFTWNTGQTLAGNYKVYSQFTENGNTIAKADTPITINALITISSRVTTDKISYFPLEPVTITSTIQSTSTNYIFENLTATITISDQQSAISLYTETRTIPILLPGQQTELKTYWNTSINPPGIYPVTLEVKDSTGVVLSISTTNITITDAIKPSKLLKGQISVDKQSLLQGEPVAITYSVTNIGNINLNQIDLSILTVHVVELTAYDTLTDQTSLQMGQTYTNTQNLSTNNYTAKDYLVILRAKISGVEETLAGTYFRVEGAPSAPSLNLPHDGSDIETYTPVLTVNNASDPNNDDLTYQFELYSDNALTTLVSSSGVISEGENITSWLVPINLQENQTYYWRARAYDGRLYGEWMMPASFRVNLTNEPPTSPTLSSPADNSEVDTLTPILTINNSYDPDSTNLTYNFEVALDADFTQLVASQIGVFEGEGKTSWQVPINLNENTYYYWRCQADDWFIEGPWMTTARFFVNTANDAPSSPSIISPSNNSEITALSADITISNSTDPDSTNLTYIFQIDTVNTFDSPNLIRSENIPEGQGTPTWHIDNLNDNTYYYIRAKASDGLSESQWSEVTGFFVNTVNDPPTTPVLANPSDGSGVNVFTPTLSVHNSTDIDRDVLTYEFELYQDAAMTNLVASITGIEETPEITSWTVPVNLTENNTYYWRARAYDGEFYSNWMTLASFMVNTANDAPSAPTLHSPSEGSSLDTLNPALSINNASDPDSDTLTYDFEIYTNGTLIQSITGIPQDISGITSVTLTTALSDNTTYNWRVRAYDGDRYGAWMDMTTFSTHLPVTNITATINFDPNTLNKKDNGKWVVVYIELPTGYNVSNIQISSILLNGTIHAEAWPYSIGDYDKDGIPDLMIKFKRADVINLLPNGDRVQLLVNGTVGTTTFEGVDTIRVIK